VAESPLPSPILNLYFAGTPGQFSPMDDKNILSADYRQQVPGFTDGHQLSLWKTSLVILIG